MSSQQKLEKMQLRQSYRNVWHTDLMSTLQADTPYCCFALCCAPCVSYLLRERALYNDMSRYTCCGGYMPCSGRCGERRCPEFCLCMEVFLCFGNSVASTRFLLQDEFNIQTTQCDNCIIGFMFCLQQLACIFSLVALIVGSDEIQEASQLLSCLADYVYCTVCACMQTQHKIEMDKRDGKFGPQPVMAVPPVQQMSRIDQQVPPSVAYTTQPPYGQPYGYPPYQQPPSHGYPPYQQPPSHGYPPAQQPPSHGYQPAQQHRSDGYPPAQQPPSHGYTPAEQPPSHGYTPAEQPPSQGNPANGYPAPAYPPSPPSYPPPYRPMGYAPR